MRPDPASNPLPPPPFRLSHPDTLELREGGGRFAIGFGAPLFLAGVLMALSITRLVPYLPMPSPNSDQWVLSLVTLVFLLFGAGMLFGRRWLKVTLGGDCVIRQYRLLIPLHSIRRSLSEFDAVMIAYDPGDAESPVRYPVLLRAASGKNFGITRPEQFSESRKHAEYLCRFLRLPLQDTTTDHRSVISHEHVGSALTQRLQSADLSAERIARPPDLSCEVTEGIGSATIVITGGNSIRAALTVLIVAMVLLITVPIFLHTFSPASSRGIAFLILIGSGIIVGIPLLSWCIYWIISLRTKTVIAASAAGLVIERRTHWGTTATQVSAGDVLDVDLRTGESAEKSAAKPTAVSPPLTEPVTSTEQILAVLRRGLPGRGVIVKSRRELITFAESLPAPELAYLRWVLRKALTGH